MSWMASSRLLFSILPAPSLLYLVVLWCSYLKNNQIAYYYCTAYNHFYLNLLSVSCRMVKLLLCLCWSLFLAHRHWYNYKFFVVLFFMMRVCKHLFDLFKPVKKMNLIRRPLIFQAYDCIIHVPCFILFHLPLNDQDKKKRVACYFLGKGLSISYSIAYRELSIAGSYCLICLSLLLQ